jgi:hypothetical protein
MPGFFRGLRPGFEPYGEAEVRSLRSRAEVYFERAARSKYFAECTINILTSAIEVICTYIDFLSSLC